jgi:hypothetical protein
MCTENHVYKCTYVRTYVLIMLCHNCTRVRTYTYTYVRTVYVLIMLCYNFLIGKGRTSALRTTCVVGVRTLAVRTVHVYYTMVVAIMLYHNVVCTYTCTNITLSQKRLEIQALRCDANTTMVASGRTMVRTDVRTYTRVRTYVHVYVRTYVHVYVRTYNVICYVTCTFGTGYVHVYILSIGSHGTRVLVHSQLLQLTDR